MGCAIYSPVAHWVWGGVVGFTQSVQLILPEGRSCIFAGVSGLVLALMLGSRKPDNKAAAQSCDYYDWCNSSLVWMVWI